jgi:steroid delta-isomerase
MVSFCVISRPKMARVDVISAGFTSTYRKVLTVNDFSCSGPEPFHEVTGVAAIRAILRHTFDKLPGARFRVTRRFPGDEGHAVILWEMDFTMPVTRQPSTIRGDTHLTFANDGKVTLHRDYWDAAEELYGRLPVLKWLMRALARRAAAPR